MFFQMYNFTKQFFFFHFSYLKVISVSREISGENFTKFINDVNRRIFALIQSNDNDEKIGGILAIGIYYYFYFYNLK